MRTMGLGAENICAAIEKYQNDEVGTAWEIFWDYKCNIEKGGGNIFDDNNLELTTMHLFIYLCCFGMVRGPNALVRSDLGSFTEVIKNSKKHLIALSPIKFEELKENDRSIVKAAYDGLSNELKEKHISYTETMIT